jgi:hypothetical protein
MSYKFQYVVGIVVALALAALGAIQAAGGGPLGTSPRAMAWLGVLTAVLGIARSFLPRLNVTPGARRDMFVSAATDATMPSDLAGDPAVDERIRGRRERAATGSAPPATPPPGGEPARP